MRYSKVIAISYRDRLDLAHLIVEQAPSGYTGFKLGAKLSPSMQLVGYDSASLAGYDSLQDLRLALGIAKVRKPSVVKYGLKATTYMAEVTGQTGVFLEGQCVGKCKIA